MHPTGVSTLACHQPGASQPRFPSLTPSEPHKLLLLSKGGHCQPGKPVPPLGLLNSASSSLQLLVQLTFLGNPAPSSEHSPGFSLVGEKTPNMEAFSYSQEIYTGGLRRAKLLFLALKMQQRTFCFFPAMNFWLGFWFV